MRNHTCAQIWLLQTILMVTRDWGSFEPEITFSALPEFHFHTTVDEDTFVIRVALLVRCNMRGSSYHCPCWPSQYADLVVFYSCEHSFQVFMDRKLLHSLFSISPLSSYGVISPSASSPAPWKPTFGPTSLEPSFFPDFLQPSFLLVSSLLRNAHELQRPRSSTSSSARNSHSSCSSFSFWGPPSALMNGPVLGRPLGG